MNPAGVGGLFQNYPSLPPHMPLKSSLPASGSSSVSDVSRNAAAGGFFKMENVVSGCVPQGFVSQGDSDATTVEITTHHYESCIILLSIYSCPLHLSFEFNGFYPNLQKQKDYK